MGKFTPGPWRVNGPLVTAQAGMALRVCSVHAQAIGDAAHTPDESAANAALIAAAPNLLAALELAHELLNDSETRHFISTKRGNQAGLHAFLNSARAAIAKAVQS